MNSLQVFLKTLKLFSPKRKENILSLLPNDSPVIPNDNCSSLRDPFCQNDVRKKSCRSYSFYQVRSPRC